LPARIDERDFQKASRAAAAATDSLQARSCWQAYLAQHAGGGHVTEVSRLLDELVPWKVNLLRATLDKDYTEDDTRVTPSSSSMLAVLRVEFEATSASPGSPADRLQPGVGILSADALDYLAGKKELVEADVLQNIARTERERLTKPARLFLSSQVDLVLSDHTRLHSLYTSCPPGYGVTVLSESGRLSQSFGGGQEEAVLRYLRGPTLTAVLVQPRKKVELSLLYTVPQKTERATLQFYDCPPVAIVFGR